jgi:ABC-type nitrate/sulfonate/bicarbonate transport system ATPase subunit
VAPDRLARVSAIDAAIRLDGLTKRYPGASRLAVDHLDLDVPRGEIVALVGPSGCGKTTTLKMINRLVEPTEGRVLIDGVEARTIAVHELRRGIGYVIQHAGLFPHRTVAANIARSLACWTGRRSGSATESASWPSSSASSPSSWGATRPRCRAGSSSASVWHVPWRPTRRCC